MGEAICDLRTGLNPRSNFALNTQDASGYYITVRELDGFNVVVTEKTDLVSLQSLEVIQRRSNLKDGDVLFSGTGTIGKTALVKDFTDSWNIKEGVYALTPKPEILNNRFLIHVLHSSQVRNAILGRADGATVASISMANLRKILIPIPIVSEQVEMVERLDKFDALTNDLSAGLPAEISARRKQYEYYRDKLLTFKELESA